MLEIGSFTLAQPRITAYFTSFTCLLKPGFVCWSRNMVTVVVVVAAGLPTVDVWRYLGGSGCWRFRLLLSFTFSFITIAIG